jgi:hypothetical protein
MLSQTQGQPAAGRMRKIEKIHFIRARARDLPTCSVVSQRTTLPRGTGPCTYGKVIQLLRFLLTYTEFANKLNMCFIAGVEFSIDVSIMVIGSV